MTQKEWIVTGAIGMIEGQNISKEDHKELMNYFARLFDQYKLRSCNIFRFDKQDIQNLCECKSIPLDQIQEDTK